MDLKFLFFLSNYILGAVLVFLSLKFFYSKKSVAPLYISFAVIIAGPLEDMLVDFVNSLPNIPPNKRKTYLWLVDQVTSLGFLIFLIIAVIESSK